MKSCSVEGVKLLRALALTVRSEQDFELTPNPNLTVGVLRRSGASIDDAKFIKHNLGYESALRRKEFEPIRLRHCLNKIAHADPTASDFYVRVEHQNHDLLLFGEERGQRWFAAISILRLIEAIRALPDASVLSQGGAS